MLSPSYGGHLTQKQSCQGPLKCQVPAEQEGTLRMTEPSLAMFCPALAASSNIHFLKSHQVIKIMATKSLEMLWSQHQQVPRPQPQLLLAEKDKNWARTLPTWGVQPSSPIEPVSHIPVPSPAGMQVEWGTEAPTPTLAGGGGDTEL